MPNELVCASEDALKLFLQYLDWERQNVADSLGFRFQGRILIPEMVPVTCFNNNLAENCFSVLGAVCLPVTEGRAVQ